MKIIVPFAQAKLSENRKVKNVFILSRVSFAGMLFNDVDKLMQK